MKILCDFDGVLTLQNKEANAVRSHFMGELERLYSNEGALRELLRQAERELREHPTENGWNSSGAISAFADEDVFIRNNALSNVLDRLEASGDPRSKEMMGALRAGGYESYEALMNWAYSKMVEETMAGVLQPLEPSAIRTLEILLGRGVEVVIVSNSGTERIEDLLKKGGLPTLRHADGRDPSRIRIRGDAEKFRLGGTECYLEVGSYRVPVHRPSYHEILEEEKPHAVVGDVFSLDLALPLHLARSRPESFSNIKLFLRTRDYTPHWSREFFETDQEDNASLHLLDPIEKLPELLLQ